MVSSSGELPSALRKGCASLVAPLVADGYEIHAAGLVYACALNGAVHAHFARAAGPYATAVIDEVDRDARPPLTQKDAFAAALLRARRQQRGHGRALAEADEHVRAAARQPG